MTNTHRATRTYALQTVLMSLAVTVWLSKDLLLGAF